METLKINTATAKTINDTIAIGQYLINSGNRVFYIGNVTNDQVQLVAANSEKSQVLTFSRKTFVQLYTRRNWTQLHNPANYLAENAEARAIGSQRFLAK
jgi:hypothetical protein